MSVPCNYSKIDTGCQEMAAGGSLFSVRLWRPFEGEEKQGREKCTIHSASSLYCLFSVGSDLPPTPPPVPVCSVGSEPTPGRRVQLGGGVGPPPRACTLSAATFRPCQGPSACERAYMLGWTQVAMGGSRKRGGFHN